MTTATTTWDKYNAMRGQQTLYELVAEHTDGRKVLVAYCQRKNRRFLYHALQKRSDHVERVFGTTQISFGKRAADGATMGDWRLFFTGRTRRDCLSGEHLYIADANLLPVLVEAI